MAARREGVQFLVAGGLSQCRACVLLQLQRSTLAYRARPDRNAELAAQVHELALRHARYGVPAGVGIAPASWPAGA